MDLGSDVANHLTYKEILSQYDIPMIYTYIDIISHSCIKTLPEIYNCHGLEFPHLHIELGGLDTPKVLSCPSYITQIRSNTFCSSFGIRDIYCIEMY